MADSRDYGRRYQELGTYATVGDQHRVAMRIPARAGRRRPGQWARAPAAGSGQRHDRSDAAHTDRSGSKDTARLSRRRSIFQGKVAPAPDARRPARVDRMLGIRAAVCRVRHSSRHATTLPLAARFAAGRAVVRTAGDERGAGPTSHPGGTTPRAGAKNPGVARGLRRPFGREGSRESKMNPVCAGGASEASGSACISNRRRERVKWVATLATLATHFAYYRAHACARVRAIIGKMRRIRRKCRSLAASRQIGLGHGMSDLSDARCCTPTPRPVAEVLIVATDGNPNA